MPAIMLLDVSPDAATFALAHTVIPHTQAALQERVLRDPEELLYNLLRRERTFRAGNFPYVIHVCDVQGRRLIDLVLKRWKMVKDASGKDISTGTFDVVIRAREARLRVQLPDADHPNEQPMLYIDPDRWVMGDGAVSMISNGNGPVGVPLPEMFSSKDIAERPSNLTWDRLPAKAHQFEEKYDASVEDHRLAAEQALKITDPAIRARWDEHVMHLGYLSEHWLRQVRNTLCEFNIRPAPGTQQPRLRPDRRAGRAVLPPGRLPQFVRHLLPADGLCVLSAAAGRLEHGPRWQSADARGRLRRGCPDGGRRRRAGLAAHQALTLGLTASELRSIAAAMPAKLRIHRETKPAPIYATARSAALLHQRARSLRLARR